VNPILPRITRLSLHNFRSYKQATVETSSAINILIGENGAGKTNILEALSLFGQGRGLHRAGYDKMVLSGQSNFALNITVNDFNLGTGVENGVRQARLNQAEAHLSDFADILCLIWLTPQMDGLFLGAASERRKFLDRLVLALDTTHGTRVNALERALRSRNKLLEENASSRWLDAAEKELAELALSVSFARVECVARLASYCQTESRFPACHLNINGFMEEFIPILPAIELEERYRKALYEGRGRDRAAGRTLEGAHRSDLCVTHVPSQTLAAQCSTGQQKALLIRLILAHAQLITDMTAQSPIILLDDVVAFLDETRREALFESLLALNAQVWMSGVEIFPFASISEKASIFEVRRGEIVKI
jgi:DNA replication and repair protein RecF